MRHQFSDGPNLSQMEFLGATTIIADPICCKKVGFRFFSDIDLIITIVYHKSGRKSVQFLEVHVRNRDQLIEIINEYIETLPPAQTKRGVVIEPIRGKASILIGVRRSGKSTIMAGEIRALLSQAVRQSHILYLNFFDDRLRGLDLAGLDTLFETYREMRPEIAAKDRIYCFFDEIQSIEGWESFVERLIRRENCDVWLTGSSAAMLSKEIATQMRGRALSWEVFPFSFQEFLTHRQVAFAGPISVTTRRKINQCFDDYWQTGGFPEVLDLQQHMRVMVHQEYLRTILFRDLIERHEIGHPKALMDMTHQLIENVASQHSINSLSKYLKTLGHKIQKSTVSQYLDWLEDAYFLYGVRIFDASVTRTEINPRKIYCADHALVKSISLGILENSGHLLENLVYITLRRKNEKVFYYRTATGLEVDFVTVEAGRKRRLIQVAENLMSPKTRERELKALVAAMREQKIKDGTIVTRAEDENIETDAGAVQVISIAKFLLAN